MQDMADDINYDELIKMIEELYCMSKKALVNYALRHINTKAEAEDVVQNSFVTMLRKPHLFKFDKPQDNIPYMMIVVRNEATKYMRSVEREVHSEIDHAANIIDQRCGQKAQKDPYQTPCPQRLYCGGDPLPDFTSLSSDRLCCFPHLSPQCNGISLQLAGRSCQYSYGRKRQYRLAAGRLCFGE